MQLSPFTSLRRVHSFTTRQPVHRNATPALIPGIFSYLQQSTQQSATSLDLLPGFIFWTTSFFSDTSKVNPFSRLVK